KLVGFDLDQGKEVPAGTGDIQVSFTREGSTNRMFGWRWSISVRDGGVLASTREFDFQAPSDGYAESDEVHFPVSDAENWRDELVRSYFLRFNSGTYGRISVRLRAYNGIFRF